MDFERFVFPLDALRNWNRLYGKRGVFQFQCVIPYEQADKAIRELLQMAATYGLASPLGVLKTLDGEGRGYLSFPMEGFTLALDFPRTSNTNKLIRRMYEITLAYSGRVYLAKDAFLEPEQLRQMYPDYGEFVQVLDEIDPNRIMQSDMSRRLCIRYGPGGEDE